MQFSSILPALGLATTALAIDGEIHFRSNCDDRYVYCANLTPNRCCRFGDGNIGFPAVRFSWIPPAWTIQTRGYSGGQCKYPRSTLDAVWLSNVCHGRGSYTGLDYGFISKRRDASEPETSTGKDCVHADTLVLNNGERYELKELDDGQAEELFNLVVNGTTPADAPDAFKSFVGKRK